MMALRRLNVLNFRNIAGCGIRWCSRDIPDDLIISTLEPEAPAAEISSIPLKKDENRLLKEIKNNDSFLFTPAIPLRSETVAPFVPKSEVLQNLIKLGVDLSKVEKDPEMAEYFIKADFKQDIQPYILFLYDRKILPEDMGQMFTRHPSIFKESLDNLQLRIDYFKSKNFSEESIVRIVTKQPSVLTTSTLITDKQLGFLQKTFQLQGDEVREVVTKYPKLIVWEQDSIRDNRLHMMGILGFKTNEIKMILLDTPRLFTSGKLALEERFDYLHNKIGLSHEEILRWPGILRTRLHILKQRHQFLKFVGKDQFDRNSENYISTKALVSGSDSEFCDLVAKVPVQMFNDFLKSL